MRIGIDFDNTIACYDTVFHQLALEKNLIPASLQKSKGAVRDYLRAAGQEEEWTAMQGDVYGNRMDLAKPYPGVAEFFQKSRGAQLCIISHKTLYPFKGPKYPLHEAARGWLQGQSFYHSGIATFFELTKEEKLKRIERMQCDYFIDDLPEFLAEEGFPKKTKKILFDPSNLYSSSPHYQRIPSWYAIYDLLAN